MLFSSFKITLSVEVVDADDVAALLLSLPCSIQENMSEI